MNIEYIHAFLPRFCFFLRRIRFTQFCIQFCILCQCQSYSLIRKKHPKSVLFYNTWFLSVPLLMILDFPMLYVALLRSMYLGIFLYGPFHHVSVYALKSLAHVLCFFFRLFISVRICRYLKSMNRISLSAFEMPINY